MKKLFAILLLAAVIAVPSFSQQNSAPQKFALVIGNGNYTGKPWNNLRNAVNDATDMKAALEGLGFQVEYIHNGNLNRMQTAVINLKQKLRASPNSYGFFYYAGHGAQNRDGQNYLIPVDADTPSLNLLPQRALPVQFVLDELEEAKNELNMIVLDACRDVPALDRSGSRGLSVMGQIPRGSIVMYATSANKTASDGEGRNGLFTSHLLRNLKTPGLAVNEIFMRTGSDVARATGGDQYPEIRQMYFETAYLGTRSAAPPERASYKIGDTGPAGGIVFYDKGNNTDGWQYLEAAPVDLQQAEWGLYGENVSGTRTGIGSGKRNTELIIAALNRRGESGKAAQLCGAYTLNGYNDWFLPSKDELNELYKNLASKRLGNFKTTWDTNKWTHCYWSSSQQDIYYVLLQYFSIGNGQHSNDGIQVGTQKDLTISVRAVRSF